MTMYYIGQKLEDCKLQPDENVFEFITRCRESGEFSMRDIQKHVLVQTMLRDLAQAKDLYACKAIIAKIIQNVMYK